MAVNKVVKSDGTTLIDLTEDTVTSSDHIVNGYVGHLRSGEQVTGTGGVTDVLVNDTSIVTNGVAEIPKASNALIGFGVTRGNADQGISVSQGVIAVYGATSNDIKAGSHQYRPTVPLRQHESVFYGLAKASGDTTQSASSNAVGTYTEEAKSAISDMLNGAVSVSGTTPTITAMSGVRYVCGEVSTLDITPCASGICDIVFTSGSTPTVLTLPSTVKFPDGAFVPEANTTYEVNIMDGVYGAVMAWT